MENCQNIKCYKLDDVVLNASIVCFVYDRKIYDIDTLLPYWGYFIVKYDMKTDKYLIHNMLNGEQYEEYYSIFTSAILDKLLSGFLEDYQEALSIEPELYEYTE